MYTFKDHLAAPFDDCQPHWMVSCKTLREALYVPHTFFVSTFADVMIRIVGTGLVMFNLKSGLRVTVNAVI